MGNGLEMAEKEDMSSPPARMPDCTACRHFAGGIVIQM